MNLKEKTQKIHQNLLDSKNNLFYARTAVIEAVQLAEEIKSKTGAPLSTLDLHNVCIKLAKQRSLLQGQAVDDFLKFNYLNSSDYNQAISLIYPRLDDGGKTSFACDFYDEGMNNVNSSIISNYSDYFFTRYRDSGELVSIDIDTTAFIGPSVVIPFIPKGVIISNGETSGIPYTIPDSPDNPNHENDIRYEYSYVPASGLGTIGGGFDLVETKFGADIFTTLELTDVSGTFNTIETLINNDIELNVRSYRDDLYVELLLTNVFVNSLIDLTEITDVKTENTLEVVERSKLNDTTYSIKCKSNNGTENLSIGFTPSSVQVLNSKSLTHFIYDLSISAPNNTLGNGDVIQFSGFTGDYEQFNGQFLTITYASDNGFSVVLPKRVNTPVIIEDQVQITRDLLHIGNGNYATITQNSQKHDGSIDVDTPISDFEFGGLVTQGENTARIKMRTDSGSWETSNDFNGYVNQIKTYNTTTKSYELPSGVEEQDFWIKNYEPVNISNISTITTNTEVINKITLELSLSDGKAGTFPPFPPKLLFSYPIKSWNDTTTAPHFSNIANAVVISQGLKLNDSWDELNSSPESATVLSSSQFKAILGFYGKDYSVLNDDVLTSCSSIQSSGSMSKTDNESNESIASRNASSLYPDINKNPFYPSVGGTHKNHTDTDNSLIGTQPDVYTDEDVYCGQFFLREPGRKIENTSQEIIDDFEYRYAVFNDLKFMYAGDPEKSNLLGKIKALPLALGDTNTSDLKRSGPKLPVLQSKVLEHINAITTEFYNAGVSLVDLTQTFIPGNDITPIPVSGATTTSIIGLTYNVYEKSGNFINHIVYKVIEDPDPLAAAGDKIWSIFSNTVLDHNYNKVMAVLTELKGIQTQLNALNDLHPFATSSIFDTFEDKLSSTTQTDDEFRIAMNTFKPLLDDLISSHDPAAAGSFGNTYTTNTTSVRDYSGNPATSLSKLLAVFDDNNGTIESEWTTFVNIVSDRITEIDRRIGVLNGRSSDGGNFSSSVNSGWSGATFTDGKTYTKGYGGAIFDSVNTMAGKKIGYVKDVIEALNDIDEIYKQILKNQSKYTSYINL